MVEMGEISPRRYVSTQSSAAAAELARLREGVNFLLTNAGASGLPRLRQNFTADAAMIACRRPRDGQRGASYALIPTGDAREIACGDAGAAFARRARPASPSPARASHGDGGFDASRHAVETHVSTNATALRAFSREGVAAARSNYERLLREPETSRRAARCSSALTSRARPSRTRCRRDARLRQPRRAIRTEQARRRAQLPTVVRWTARRSASLRRDPEISASRAATRARGGTPRPPSRVGRGGRPGRASERGWRARADLRALAGEAAGQWTGRFNPRRSSQRRARTLRKRYYEGLLTKMRAEKHPPGGFVRAARARRRRAGSEPAPTEIIGPQISTPPRARAGSSASPPRVFRSCSPRARVGQDSRPARAGRSSAATLRDGFSRAGLPDRLRVAWTFEAGESIESSAAIVGGTVYVGTQKGELVALGLADGAVRWRYATKAGIGESSPAVSGGVVYVGDLSGVVHAVSARDGRAVWTYKTGAEIKSSPVVSAGRVLIAPTTDTSTASRRAAGGSCGGSRRTRRCTRRRPWPTASLRHGLRRDSARGARHGRARGYQVKSGAYTGASPALMQGNAFYGNFDNEVLGVNLVARRVGWRYQNRSGSSLLLFGGRGRRAHHSRLGATRSSTASRGRDRQTHLGVHDAGARRLQPALAAAESSSLERRATLRARLLRRRKTQEFNLGAPVTASPAVARAASSSGTTTDASTASRLTGSICSG